MAQNGNSREEVDRLVDHLFRHKFGQLMAVLTSYFGLENLQLAEDVVQESLVTALRQWPYSGVPQNPSGWILRVAKNRAIDELRRNALFRDRSADLTHQIEQRMASALDSNDPIAVQFQDEQLTMMFTCCHPAFSESSQASLILKNLCGFSVTEIARAFLTEESTIAQRLVRAKRKIVKERIRFEVPRPSDLLSRIDTVLQALYLLFNEGYSASGGENLLREELCEESLRLVSMLASHPLGNIPKVHALLSLICFQAARLPSRIDSEGNLLLLSEQDRALTDHRLMQLGFYHLQKSQTGRELSEYHLQAGIAACHAAAPAYEQTDWEKILGFYDLLLAINPSPVFQLNRAVAIAMLRGPQEGIGELRKIEESRQLESYYLLPATLAEFYRRLDNKALAREYYEQALKLATTTPEKKFLQKRLISTAEDAEDAE